MPLNEFTRKQMTMTMKLAVPRMTFENPDNLDIDKCRELLAEYEVTEKYGCGLEFLRKVGAGTLIRATGFVARYDLHKSQQEHLEKLVKEMQCGAKCKTQNKTCKRSLNEQ